MSLLSIPRGTGSSASLHCIWMMQNRLKSVESSPLRHAIGKPAPDAAVGRPQQVPKAREENHYTVRTKGPQDATKRVLDTKSETKRQPKALPWYDNLHIKPIDPSLKNRFKALAQELGTAPGKICKPRSTHWGRSDSQFMVIQPLKRVDTNGQWIPIKAPAPESREAFSDSKMDGQWRYLGLYKYEKKDVMGGPREYRRLSEEVRKWLVRKSAPIGDRETIEAMFQSGELEFRRLHYRRVGFTTPLYERLLALSDALHVNSGQDKTTTGEGAVAEDRDVPRAMPIARRAEL